MKKQTLSSSILSLSIALILLSGCSFFSSNNSAFDGAQAKAGDGDQAKVVEDENTPSETEVVKTTALGEMDLTKEMNSFDATTDGNGGALEILWQVPTGEPVDSYQLDYGTTQSELSRHIVIPVSSLEKFDHPTYGPVFRYYLRAVPKDKDVYVTLRAENQHGVSDSSGSVQVR